MNRYDDPLEVPMLQTNSDESFEASEKLCENSVSDSNSTLFKYLNDEDDHKRNNVMVWHKTSDESFEALERMCDKTASDPNSTLFQYLHSDRKEQVLAEVKKRSTDGNNLNDRNEEEDNLLMKINNCTLLDDVEAPSRMWENTICGDTILQTSPVKIVALLRPSTIIEETPDDSENSDISSQMSFRTATKDARSDVSSTSYETGDDFSSASSICRPQEVDVFDLDELLLNALEKNQQKQSVKAELTSSLETMDATIVERTSLSKCGENNVNINDVSVDLIDLEKTFAPLYEPPYSSIVGESEKKEVQNIENEFENKKDSHNVLDTSVIEIISDDEDDENDEIKDVQNIDNICCKEQQIPHNINTETSSESIPLNINYDTYSFNESDESNKENLGETDEPSEKSMQFNDTMEEVEYMLKRGLEYMAAEAAAKICAGKNKAASACNDELSGTQTSSPMKQIEVVKHVSSTTSNAKSSLYTTPAKKTQLSKGHSSTSKRFDIDIKPFPKFDIFAKPPVHARTKELAGKQQKFSHIVSPIGTYMKKTAHTPLMSSINCKNKDYFNSSAILHLENESRLNPPQFLTDLNGSKEMELPTLPGVMIGAKRPLPKKAYISSDLKHIVDDRTPVTIPGGKKIQKYLENAMMPAVLRHEGKLKLPGGISNKLNSSPKSSSDASSMLPLKASDTNSKVPALHVPRRINASLADLSLMSGDVSMYTIMDAQKF